MSLGPFNPKLSHRISLAKAIRLWVISVGITLSIGLVGLMLWREWEQQRCHQDHFQLHRILQTGPEVEALRTQHLAEICGLSENRPVNLYGVSLKYLQQRLIETPWIQEATLRRRPPDTLEIIYTLRQPIAILADLDNALIDRQGAIIPYQPFLRARKLPYLWVGLSKSAMSPWGKKIWGTTLQGMPLEIWDAIIKHPVWSECSLLGVDASKISSPDYGRREIILEVQLNSPQKSRSFWIRLPTHEIEERLSQLQEILPQLREHWDPHWVDLRIPNQAIIMPKVVAAKVL